MESIKLIIRTANNKYPDFYLEISPLLTVYDLKQKITINHPTKPIPKDQRLICSGKLLEDTNLLNQVFIKSTSGSSFMIHLVLDSDKNATQTPKTPRPTTVNSTTTPIITEQPPPFERPTSPSHSSTYEQYLEELNKYQQQLQQFVMNPNGPPPTCNYETQAYLQYCYTHYQMYQNLVAYQRTAVASSTTINAPTNPIEQPNFTNAAAPPPPAPAPQAAGGNNNNNDNEQENDLLGILNMLIELFVLCSIIYFYSTFSRFLVVFVLFALLYLHCRGYLSIQRRRRAHAQPAPVVPEQAAGNDGEQDDNEAEPAANEGQNQNDIQRPPPGPVGENQVTTTRLLFTAISTFFSSLIPERPQRA